MRVMNAVEHGFAASYCISYGKGLLGISFQQMQKSISNAGGGSERQYFVHSGEREHCR
jgi:hypothetical protein